MRNIKLLIEYDGTNYGGWQRQPNNITVQQKIEEAIFKITNEKVNLIGSSRTDAGVHAKGMVANFMTESRIPDERFREAINTKLPDDIAILKSEEVDGNFHARYNSKGKMYSYTIINRYEKVSLGRNYSYHVKEKLDIKAMQKACEYFIGKKDFKAFRSAGGSAKTSVRTIKELYIKQRDERITVYISADGFLYNMVRIIVGTLLEVGSGAIIPEDIENIIKSGDRNKAGKCVAPNGLILEKVYY